MAFVSIASTALFNVRPEDTGAASAVLTTSQQIGGSFGTAIANTIVVSSGSAFLLAALRSHPSVTAAGEAVVDRHVPRPRLRRAFRFGALMLFLAALHFFFGSSTSTGITSVSTTKRAPEVYPAST